MSEFLRRLLLLVLLATAIAVGLVGWAGGFLAVETVDRPAAAVIAGLSLLVLSGLIAVLFEPLEVEGESN